MIVGLDGSSEPTEPRSKQKDFKLPPVAQKLVDDFARADQLDRVSSLEMLNFSFVEPKQKPLEALVDQARANGVVVFYVESRDNHKIYWDRLHLSGKSQALGWLIRELLTEQGSH